MKKNSFFSPENPFNAMLTRLFDLLVLNILWLIGCIPVVTIGASTAALYTMTLKWVDGDEATPVFKGFWHAYRVNLKQGVAVTVILLAVMGILVADFHLLGRETSNSSSLMYGFCFVLLAAAVAVFGYVFPLMAKFENTVGQMFNNAWRLAASHLPYTAIVVLLHAAPFAWFLISPSTFMAIFWFWLLIGTSVSAYVCSIFMSRIFVKLIGDGEAQES